jgi:hypothetical protein
MEYMCPVAVPTGKEEEEEGDKYAVPLKNKKTAFLCTWV